MNSIISNATPIEFLDELSIKLSNSDLPFEDLKRLDNIGTELLTAEIDAETAAETLNNEMELIEESNFFAKELLENIHKLVYTKGIKKADLVNGLKLAFDNSQFEL